MFELISLLIIAMILAIVWLFVHVNETEDRIRQILDRLSGIEAELRRERGQKVIPGAPPETSAPTPVRSTPVVPIITPQEAVPPPLPVSTAKVAATQITPPKAPVPPTPESTTNIPFATPLPIPEAKRDPLLPQFSIEAFMGVKLFAWVGGLALFLGVIFLVRYAFEHNL